MATNDGRLSRVRAAPWAEARVPAICMASALALVFVVLDARGWGNIINGERTVGLYYGDGAGLGAAADRWGAPALAVGLLALAAAAALRRLVVAGVLAAALGAVLAGYYTYGGYLGYVTLDFGTIVHGDGVTYVETGITVVGIVGLLLALSFLCAAVGAVRPRPSRPATPVLVCSAIGWLVVVAVLPRLSVLAGRAFERMLPSQPPSEEFYFAFAIPLLVVVILIAGVAALTLPRRAPVVATASLLVVLALLIPLVWCVGGLVLQLGPDLDDWVEPWVVWGATAVLAAGLVVLVAGRAGQTRLEARAALT